jgi:hypothetical protein
VVERVACFDERRVDLPPGQRLKRDGADKLRCLSCENDIDFGTRLRQQPRQPR